MSKENLKKVTIRKICMNQTLNNPKAKGLVTEQPLENYFQLTKSEELAKLIVAIRFEQNHDERRNLKSNLPFRCPHYFRFKNDHRSQANIIPEAFTFQTCVDIDNKEQVEGWPWAIEEDAGVPSSRQPWPWLSSGLVPGVPFKRLT